MGYDQTGEDANKRFGAIVSVDSITTGEYKFITLGESCYSTPEPVTTEGYEGTYKLTKFNGIDANGNADISCGVTRDSNGFYSVAVPAYVGKYKISTIGNTLFMGLNADYSLNNYTKITNVVISEGIEVIENGSYGIASFGVVGVENIDLQEFKVLSSYDLKVTIPSTMKEIGDYAFAASGIKEITFKTDEEGNTNLKTIGNDAFANSTLEKITIPAGVETIGVEAFYKTSLTSITIPSSVVSIGNHAFYENSNLTSLKFEGVTDGTSKLTSIGIYAFKGCNITSDKNNPLIFPSSLKTIGSSAFENTGSNRDNINITRIVFYDTEEYPSQLETIGEYAFYHLPLMYETDSDPLIIPPSVQTIGNSAFTYEAGYKGNLKYIQYLGDSEEVLNNNGDTGSNRWYYKSKTMGNGTILLTKENSN